MTFNLCNDFRFDGFYVSNRQKNKKQKNLSKETSSHPIMVAAKAIGWVFCVIRRRGHGGEGGRGEGQGGVAGGRGGALQLQGLDIGVPPRHQGGPGPGSHVVGGVRPRGAQATLRERVGGAGAKAEEIYQAPCLASLWLPVPFCEEERGREDKEHYEEVGEGEDIALKEEEVISCHQNQDLEGGEVL